MGYDVQSGVVVGKREGEYHASQYVINESKSNAMAIFLNGAVSAVGRVAVAAGRRRRRGGAEGGADDVHGPVCAAKAGEEKKPVYGGFQAQRS